MTNHRCHHCGADNSTGTALCKRCVTTVKTALGNLPDYHGQVLGLGREAVRTRRPRGHSDPTGTAVAMHLDPVRSEPDAGDLAAADTKAALVGYARMLIKQHPHLQYPFDTVKALAEFLTRHLPSIATFEWAEPMATEVLALEQRLRRLIERSKGKWYAGVCSAELDPERDHDQDTCVCACHAGHGACDVEGGCHPEQATIPALYCDRDLYASPGSTYVRCPECGTRWLLHERRHIMLEASREVLLPLPEIAHVVVSLVEGEPSTQRLFERLKKRTQRGLLQHRTTKVIDGRPVRLYQLSDVTDTLTFTKSETAR